MRCKAQSAAMPIGIASICNAAARPYRVGSGGAIQWFSGLLAVTGMETKLTVKSIIDSAEKLFLVVIAGFTVVAMGLEIVLLIDNRKVELKDLLLMFIYAEVLGMLGAFYSRQRNLITLPLVIAMTALSRLIILQGKDTNAVVLLYESGAILLIAVACWVISRMRTAE
jgi:protein PsiE